MKHKKKSALVRSIFKILVLVPTFLSLFSKLMTLVSLEARAAGRSFINLIIFAVMCGVILTSTWLCVLGLFAISLYYLHCSYPLILSILIIANIFIFLLLAIFMQKCRKTLFFPETREHLHAILMPNHDA